MGKTNKDNAKMPDKEDKWETIDIFLFSNGQHYSPPRKYHLTAEELIQWDATLNALARSHYGSYHKSIDLYTINGHKITGPLDLSDGVHYVAVASKDEFVDAGYEKYLMKASRSWEKRQAKRTSECKIDNIKPDIDITKSIQEETDESAVANGATKCIGTTIRSIQEQSYENAPANASPNAVKNLDCMQIESDKKTLTKNDSEAKKTLELIERDSNIHDNSPIDPKIISKIPEENNENQHVRLTEECYKDTGLHPADSPDIYPKTSPSDESPSVLNMCTGNDLTTIKTSDDVIGMESALTRPQRSSTPKCDPPEVEEVHNNPVTPVTPSLQPKRPSLVRSDKRRSAGQHPSFAKTAIAHNTLNGKSSSPFNKYKEGFQKKTLAKVPVKRNETVKNLGMKPKRINTQPPKKSPLPLEPRQKVPDDLTPTPSSPDTTLIREPSSTCQRITSISFDKDIAKEATVNLEQVADKDIIVVTAGTKIFKSTSDVGFVEVDTNTTIPVIGVDEVVSCYIVDKGIDQTAQTEKQNSANYGNMSDKEQDIHTKMTPTVITSQTLGSSNVPLGDNYIAVINKGEAVNMNLNIEIQNGIKDQNRELENEQSNYLEVQKDSSMSNIFKRKNQQDAPPTIETKSLQSVLSAINEYYAKVIVVQCGCCGTNAVVPRVDNMPVFKDESGFFILMPGPSPIPTKSCACGTNQENDKTISFVKNILSDICPKDLSGTNPAPLYPGAQQDVRMLMTVMHCGLQSHDDTQRDESDAYATTKQVCINEKQTESEYNSRTVPQQTEKAELVECKGTSRTRISCKTEDSSTQTDWCCLLIQVKHHDDDHYSFHLPPLELVKYCSR